MRFFHTEIKLNPEFVASNRILVTARRYVGSDMRWYAELNSGFHTIDPIDSIQGDRKTIKEFINKWKKSHGDTCVMTLPKSRGDYV